MSTIQDFDFSVNLLQSILWQYDDSTNLVALITAKQNWYSNNNAGFWVNWVENVFDLGTANSFGLAVWAIILGLPFFAPPEIDPPGKPIFGFNYFNPSFPTLGNSYLNFNVSNFSVAGNPLGLTNEEQRWLLRIRYFQLANRGALDDYLFANADFLIPEGMGINNFFHWLKDNSASPMDIKVYALDGLNMTMRYVFSREPSPAVVNILNNYDILPRPAGVGITKIVAPTPPIFGFNVLPYGSTNQNQNFNNGNFYPPFF